MTKQVKGAIAPPPPPSPLGENLIADWALDPKIAFLNHGCFGARPRKVLEAQWKRRLEFESHPVQYLDRLRHQHIQRAKKKLGEMIGADAADLAFVTNATGGINAVLRSLDFKSGDELLTTTHVYNAVRKTMSHIAKRFGAKYIETPVPFPVQSPDEIVEAIEAGITKRTRIAVIDHVTSPTAVIFPIERIVKLFADRGIDVIVDGAHAPGMLDLQIERVGAAYYAGNLHKWMCAPPGAAFLWVRRDKQPGVHPTTISHFLDENFNNEFNWQGTRDISPWLCVEDSIEYMGSFGWDRVMKHNHELATWGQAMLCERWDVPSATPADGSMIGSMCTVLLPGQDVLRERFSEFLLLRYALYDEFQIEVPVIDWGGKWWLRPCWQIYNGVRDGERLADAVLKLVGR